MSKNPPDGVHAGERRGDAVLSIAQINRSRGGDDKSRRRPRQG